MDKKYRKIVLIVLKKVKVQKHLFYGSLGANLRKKVLRAGVIVQMLAHKLYVILIDIKKINEILIDIHQH